MMLILIVDVCQRDLASTDVLHPCQGMTSFLVMFLHFTNILTIH